ncbi:MAG: isoleucine--tRNA ligase, partial [bacterium]
MSQKNDRNRYQSTLNLPKTDFSQRANAQEKEPEVIKRWEKENLYEKTYTENSGKQKYVMHDGPPYANGPIHIGHALNKILKDMVCKTQRMTGKHTPFKPGWDCHGLPIELKVAAELKTDTSKHEFNKKEFKKACRNYAAKWIKVQKEEFKQLGVLADWAHPYITMDPEYEADILKAFAKFIEDGYIERKGKTVPWCASCNTVLAAAEIEYKDRHDPSIYLLFPFDKKDAQEVFPYVMQKNPNLNISFLVWTTTPWTIPLNRAVVLKPLAKYVLLQGKEKDSAFIVGESLADKICQKLGIEKKVLASFDSGIFNGYKVYHPLVSSRQVPLLLDEIVSVEEGTACLHTAPGCGPEDYLLGIKNNLEIFSPLSAQGKYTKGIEPTELEGMSVFDAQGWVMKKLDELGRLLHKESVSHSYPHCWRCHKGLIFRATDQWFCNLEKNNLVANSLKATEKIKFIPSWGKDRFQAFINNRTEWCISRQREWGVPIPAIICKGCGYAHLDHKMVNKIAEFVAKEGIEYWDDITPNKLVEDKVIDANFKCPKCGAALDKFEAETDILDVWFDSGVTNYAVLKKFKELGIPCDLYLEGSDQHRGWFQSSLFASMILNDKAPMREILTHGF